MSKIKTVGIVGTGVIGTGWIIRNLAHNKIVHAYDQNKNFKNYVVYRDFPSKMTILRLEIENFEISRNSAFRLIVRGLPVKYRVIK